MYWVVCSQFQVQSHQNIGNLNKYTASEVLSIKTSETCQNVKLCIYISASSFNLFITAMLIYCFFLMFSAFYRVADTIFNTVSIWLFLIIIFYKLKKKFMTSSAETSLIDCAVRNVMCIFSLYAATWCLALLDEGHCMGNIKHLDIGRYVFAELRHYAAVKRFNVQN